MTSIWGFEFGVEAKDGAVARVVVPEATSVFHEAGDLDLSFHNAQGEIVALSNQKRTIFIAALTEGQLRAKT